ncbi:MAG: CbiX/SirB N-terminal domain-containing protein [bacterium]
MRLAASTLSAPSGRIKLIRPLPALVAAAHGTRSRPGAAMVDAVLDKVRARRPDVDASAAYVDVIAPSLATVLDRLARPAVVVPVLLSGGFHVRVDIPAVLARRPGVVATDALGPDPLLAQAMADRLAEARGGGRAATQVVMVAAGSSDPAARADIDVAASQLARRLRRPVTAAVLSGPGATLAEAVAGAPAPPDVAAYLLAEGFFADTLRAQGAALGLPVVADPIGPHAAVADLVLARYDAAVPARGTG